MAKELNLKEGRIGKLLRSYAIPSIISMLVGALYNIVDQIFIGQSVGMLGNAATNVAFPLTTFCTAVALLFGIGGAATFSLKLGAGEKKAAAQAAGNATTLLIISGVLLSAFVLLFLHPLVLLFGATPDVEPYALTYIRITAVGFPFMILTTGGTALIRGDGSPKYSMLCTLVGAILNTILDPVLIFGFDMGITGAAIATVTGQVVSAAMLVVYLFRFKTVQLRKADFVLHLKEDLKIMSLGTSHSFNQIAMMIVQIVLNNTMTHYGAASVYGSDIPLACSGILAKVTMIFFSIVIGISQGMQPIAGFNYGAKAYARVRKTYYYAAGSATVVAIVFHILLQLFPRQIVSIFGTGDELYFEFSVRYIRVYLMALFLNGIQPISSNFLTSIGFAKQGIVLSLTRQVIFLLPLLVILPRFWGIEGAMYAGPIADTIAAVVSVLMIAFEFKAMRKLQAKVERATIGGR